MAAAASDAKIEESSGPAVNPADVPTVTLNTGAKMPMIGLGTWQAPRGQVGTAVKEAIRAGYRHIDCAYDVYLRLHLCEFLTMLHSAMYDNEDEIGAALKECFDEGIVTREELFITSKLLNKCHRKDLVRPVLLKTLKDLQLSYVDLYLIHWPFAMGEDPALPYTPFEEPWAELETFFREGLVKAIGISNFNVGQMEQLLTSATVTPAVLQVELHPYLNQPALVKFCKEKGIAVTAYSPLVSTGRPWAQASDPNPLTDDRVAAVAAKYGKTPAQVVLRYGLQMDRIIIPKSSSPTRLRENIRILDFTLTPEEMELLGSFENGYRCCPFKSAKDHPLHPFPEVTA